MIDLMREACVVFAHQAIRSDTPRDGLFRRAAAH
jgi:hypothetical protein